MAELYEYKKINVSLEPPSGPGGLRGATIESAANRWAERGWRTVAVMPSSGPGYADAILIERRVSMTDLTSEDMGSSPFSEPAPGEEY